MNGGRGGGRILRVINVLRLRQNGGGGENEGLGRRRRPNFLPPFLHSRKTQVEEEEKEAKVCSPFPRSSP